MDSVYIQNQVNYSEMPGSGQTQNLAVAYKTDFVCKQHNVQSNLRVARVFTRIINVNARVVAHGTCVYACVCVCARVWCGVCGVVGVVVGWCVRVFLCGVCTTPAHSTTHPTPQTPHVHTLIELVVMVRLPCDQ